jgi:hypothetical protein
MTSRSSENRPSVDQAPHRALALLAAQPQLFFRQGSVVGSYRSDGMGGRWGPYYRLTYRVDGRQTSIYLGREGPLVAAVRERLAFYQGPRRQETWHRRVEKATRVSLRQCKQELRLHLSLRGLTLKGFEVRGWRRLHATRIPRLRIPTVRMPRIPGIVITQSGQIRITGVS